mgnify:CR=1 FL=1
MESLNKYLGMNYVMTPLKTRESDPTPPRYVVLLHPGDPADEGFASRGDARRGGVFRGRDYHS